MCLSRGNCDNLFDDHGDPRNITMTTIQNASNVAGLSIQETLANIQRGVSKALTGMTDWTGDQQGGRSGVMERTVGGSETPSNATSNQLSSAPPPPSPEEHSPYS